MVDLTPDEPLSVTGDDAAWILACAFLILTMQTGFGMLEAGCVSAKNVANIMMKNVVDVTLGGIVYWSVGYALSFGQPSNWFCGLGDFFFSPNGSSAGARYTHYMFQFSFATASTTIISGAVAERMKFTAYMVFSTINTLIYCIPASWVWNSTGFLNKLGFFDFAGAAVVHLTGGASALVAALMLGPRIGRFTLGSNYAMSSPVTALTGTFILWWAWLSFNCGSTFGIRGDLWKTAAKVAVTTLNGSIGGSFAGIILSLLMNWQSKIFDIPSIITSILAGLVSVTGSCAVITPIEALFVGGIGGAIALLLTPFLTKAGVDDPVNAVPAHFIASVWGVISVALFGQREYKFLAHHQGFAHGGGLYLLGVQILGIVTIALWSITLTAVSFLAIKYTMGIRMDPSEEILGADWVEHKVRTENFATKLEKALTDLRIKHEDVDKIAEKLVKELTNADFMQKAEGRIRNVSGPLEEEVNQENEISSVLDRALSLGKRVSTIHSKTTSEQNTPNIPGMIQQHLVSNQPSTSTGRGNARY